MSAVLDVSGHWVGYYRQYGREHPIAAEFVQQGESLSGTMIDGETESERSLTQAAQEFGWLPGADEQVFEWLRQRFPEAERLPIRAVMNLPAESRLEGTVNGHNVNFRKFYEGKSYHGFQVGEKRIGESRDGHEVQYYGWIDASGTTIQGKWLIPGSLLVGRALDGDFVLKREQASADSARAVRSEFPQTELSRSPSELRSNSREN